MRLLVTTQAIDLNDPALGFFHRWIEEIATQFTAVEVVCLREGRHVLPGNVRVYSLGKPSFAQATKGTGARAVQRMRYVWRFYRLLWQLQGRYDAVFVHMNPEYAVLGGPVWRITGKRLILWYTHRNVDLKLRLAMLFAHAVATAAPESLRIKSSKVHVIGHGIDTAAFTTSPRLRSTGAAARDGTLHDPIALITVGRITPIKRLEILLDALALLNARGVKVSLSIVGAPTVASDQAYEEKLRAKTASLGVEGIVRFVGAVPYREMPVVYGAHDISVNLAPTGGIDKAVLESMASGCLVLVANRAFAPLLGPDAELLLVEPTGASLAEKLTKLLALPRSDRRALAERLVHRARQEADISVVVDRLIALIEGP